MADVPKESAGQEYLSDVPYLRTFSGDLGPPMLRLVAALNGFPPPPAEDFDYCELGCGNGDTTAALAAAHPRSRFVGVDMNPEHVAFATRLAEGGGLDNIRFLERDFADVGGDALPDFDFICAHGVLSWISPEKRKALIAFAEARLKPGGLLYVSYNALPGWAAVEPLRRLLVDSAAEVEGSVLERARHALAVAKILRDGGAGYFASNPVARDMLETMVKVGLPYVVHEYFQPHWHPRYFADVAREMAAGSLYFIGQLPLYLNYRDLALPPQLVKLLQGIQNRVAFENLKDFALNELFRRDVYIKGIHVRSEAATREHLERTPFSAGEGEIQREVRLPCYTLKFEGPIFDALIPALSEQATTIADLAGRPALAAFGAPRIRESLLHLALGGQVSPMHRSTPLVRSADAPRYSVPLAYNRMILDQRLSNDSPIVLASPVAGTGLVVSMLDAVSIRLLTEVDPGGRSGWIRAFVARTPLRLRVGERAIDDGEQQARLLEEAFERFRVARLPTLLRLGVLEAAT